MSTNYSAVFLAKFQGQPKNTNRYDEAGPPLVRPLHRLQLRDLPIWLFHKVTVAQPGHLIKQCVNEGRKSVGKIVENENDEKKSRWLRESVLPELLEDE